MELHLRAVKCHLGSHQIVSILGKYIKLHLLVEICQLQVSRDRLDRKPLQTSIHIEIYRGIARSSLR